MAFGLGAAVHGEMLGAGGGLEQVGMVALQAAHHGGAEFAGQERILAEGFLAAPPARITEDIDVGRPEREALVLAAPAGRDRGMVLGAGLVGDDAGDPLDERAVPGGAEPDHLREDGGAAVAADPVAGLAPPVVGRHAEAFDRAALMEQLADFFEQAEPGDEIVDAVSPGQGGIEEGKHVCHAKGRNAPGSSPRRANSRLVGVGAASIFSRRPCHE